MMQGNQGGQGGQGNQAGQGGQGGQGEPGAAGGAGIFWDPKMRQKRAPLARKSVENAYP